MALLNMFLGTIGANLFGFLNLSLLSRILTKETMGTYSLFLMIVNLGLLIGVSWADSSLVRYGREEFTKTGQINNSFNSRFTFFIIGSTIVSIGYIIFNERIAFYLNLDKKIILLIISTFILNGLSGLLISILQATGRMKISAYITLFQKGVFSVFLLLIFFGVLPSFFEYVLVTFAISFLFVIIWGIFQIQFALIKPFLVTKKETLRKFWNFSWPQLIGFSGLYVTNYIDLFVIKKYLSLDDVGRYSVVYNLFNVMCGIIMVLYTVFLPIIVEKKTKNQLNEIKRYFNSLWFYVFCWSLVAFICITFSDNIIILIFSEKYIDSSATFTVLLVATIFYFIKIYLMPIMHAWDFMLLFQTFNIITGMINAVIDFLLVPKIGIIGAAYGTLISFSIISCFIFAYIKIKENKLFKLST